MNPAIKAPILPWRGYCPAVWSNGEMINKLQLVIIIIELLAQHQSAATGQIMDRYNEEKSKPAFGQKQSFILTDHFHHSLSHLEA